MNEPIFGSESKTQPVKRLHYKNPPLHEAKCIINFVESHTIDEKATQALYQRVKSTYDGMPKMESLQNNPFAIPSLGSTQRLTANFTTMDDSGRLAVSANQLTVTEGLPYEGWIRFRDRIHRAITAWVQVFGDSAITTITLGYDNFIFVPYTGPISLKQYFTCPPVFPNPTGNYKLSGFYSSVNLAEAGVPGRVSLNLGSVTNAKQRTFFSLQISGISADLRPTPISSILPEVERIKERVNTIFESVITDETRQLFGGYES